MLGLDQAVSRGQVLALVQGDQDRIAQTLDADVEGRLVTERT